MLSSSSSFESFWSVSIPDYEAERYRLAVKLGVAVAAWLLVGVVAGFSSAAATLRVAKPRRANKHEKRKDDPPPPSVAGLLGFVAVVFVLTVNYLLLKVSPDNAFHARSVFQAPLLTAQECQIILDMAEAAAARNMESIDASNDKLKNETATALLKHPQGWQKTRHGHYPTTDLNLVADPFEKKDLKWLANLLDRRLAPTLSRLYGIPAASIRANDMFVVRYDAGVREHLEQHVDDSDISINILLNEPVTDFTGGGTRFWRRNEDDEPVPLAHVQPSSRGTVIANTARLLHEGMPITSGTRFILVGFLAVDRIDPFHHKPTGLSVFSSWLSLNWMAVKLREGYKASQHRSGQEHPLLGSLLSRLSSVLEVLGDLFVPHRFTVLVQDEDASSYLEALDASYNATSEDRASWFRGQQISVDMSGKMFREWPLRKEHSSRFDEL